MQPAARSLPRALRIASALPPEAWLPLMLFAGGWLGLQLGPMVLALREAGPAGVLALSGLGPLDLMALLASGTALWRGAQAGGLRAPLWASLLCTAMLMAPSSLLAAAGLCLFGGLTALRSQAAARWGALGMAGIGAVHLGVALGDGARSVLIGWEALATHAALSWFEPGVVLAGPVLRMPDGHGIAILAGCSVAHFLPPALVALVVTRRAQSPARPVLGPALLLALLLLGLNLARLMLLAWSPLAYAWGHGLLGANLFGLLCLMLVQAIADD